jgi:hypothetical protein
MPNDARDGAKESPQDTLTLCLAIIALTLAWLVVGVAFQKGFLPQPPEAVIDWTRAALGG